MINNVLGTASTTADLRRKLTSSMKETWAGADRIVNAYDGTEASFTDTLAAAHDAECGNHVVGAGPVRFLDPPPRIAGFFPSDLRLAAALERGPLLPDPLAETPFLGLADVVLNQLLATVADR